MNIDTMTRKDFESLPLLDTLDLLSVDSVVLLPTRQHHDSGYNNFYVIPCKSHEPLGKCDKYDTFSIYMESSFNRVGIDCLRGSSLMRIFLPQNEYIVEPVFHQIIKKKEL